MGRPVLLLLLLLQYVAFIFFSTFNQQTKKTFELVFCWICVCSIVNWVANWIDTSSTGAVVHWFHLLSLNFLLPLLLHGCTFYWCRNSRKYQACLLCISFAFSWFLAAGSTQGSSTAIILLPKLCYTTQPVPTRFRTSCCWCFCFLFVRVRKIVDRTSDLSDAAIAGRQKTDSLPKLRACTCVESCESSSRRLKPREWHSVVGKKNTQTVQNTVVNNVVPQ